ncbi:MAG: hypothetical protein ACOC41_06945 [Chitinivibrionales bacterium]
MALFFISILSVLILFFLASLAMQAIRMERAIERQTIFVEQKVKARLKEMQEL